MPIGSGSGSGLGSGSALRSGSGSGSGSGTDLREEDQREGGDKVAARNDAAHRLGAGGEEAGRAERGLDGVRRARREG